MAAIDITPILKFMVDKNGSDLFFSAGTGIHIDIEGQTIPINAQAMAPGMVKEIAYALMSPAQQKEFEQTLEMNFALSLHGPGASVSMSSASAARWRWWCAISSTSFPVCKALGCRLY